MQRHSPEHADSVGHARPRHARPLRVLVVDADPKVGALLAEGLADQEVDILVADTVARAHELAAAGAIDVALVDPVLPDGSGIALAGELSQLEAAPQTIVMSGEPSMERAIDAIRAGANDFMVKPVDMVDLNERVHKALARRKEDRRQSTRVQKLRKICKRLNAAHHEMSRQVDTLCNDLVTAYQELAAQMHQVSATTEFVARVRDELDLGRLLRKTLEYLLEKAGPTNAAVFLPASADEYSLGAYVNLDCPAESASLLHDHMGDVLAPQIAETGRLVHITEPVQLRTWLGDDVVELEHMEMVTFACLHADEALAVVCLFRSRETPFDRELVRQCELIAPAIGDRLAKVIRVHHRHIPGFGDAA